MNSDKTILTGPNGSLKSGSGGDGLVTLRLRISENDYIELGKNDGQYFINQWDKILIDPIEEDQWIWILSINEGQYSFYARRYGGSFQIRVQDINKGDIANFFLSLEKMSEISNRIHEMIA